MTEAPGTGCRSRVTQLSGFLRHSLGSTTATVPLARELEVVNDYLALESIRLEERRIDSSAR